MKNYVKPRIIVSANVNGILPLAAVGAAVTAAAGAATSAAASIVATKAFAAGATAGMAYAMGPRKISPLVPLPVK